MSIRFYAIYHHHYYICFYLDGYVQRDVFFVQSTIFLLSANNQLHFYENVVRLFIRSSVECGVKSKIQSRVGVVMMMKMIAQKEVENVFRG